MILKIDGCKNAYNVEHATNEELKDLLIQTGCVHIWANEKTINGFRVPFWSRTNWYTIVNKVVDNVIFINKWC